jgi:hypothetical protein
MKEDDFALVQKYVVVFVSLSMLARVVAFLHSDRSPSAGGIGRPCRGLLEGTEFEPFSRASAKDSEWQELRPQSRRQTG